ncbi:RNA polymerase sigma factor sigA isoform X2 [Malania oleifera]|uniref:RNA polymerase sigma factor sigA isoform X2 n=1 Tax=Malania oleifera TaxID=397392 RepID=UPI0025AE852C|nr:RNA polymerase sigma factor sigA isoform X2 [Malania oleifera]XP_057969960.1 RNA polymerase sigma factor sigA isoform X2 [Malania oleifera]
MMATGTGTAAVIGLSAGKRFLSSSFHYSDVTDKLSNVAAGDLHTSSPHYHYHLYNNITNSRRPSNYSPLFPSNRPHQSIKALKEHVGSASDLPTTDPWIPKSDAFEEIEGFDPDSSVEALLLLQKSMLEKQWNLSFEPAVVTPDSPAKRDRRKVPVTCSGVSARQRRMNSRRRNQGRNGFLTEPSMGKQLRSMISPDLLRTHPKGYVKGVTSEKLLSQAEVARLSKKIKAGLSLEDHKSRLKERLGYEPSNEQLATSLGISRAELQSKMIECSFAREKLAMSNVRLVMSIAQRYENMGAEMADLVQGGLIGLLRGIEKFDSSKGFKISTYAYWWIRQRVAKSLNMSEKKVRNAAEADSKVFSLDREAFPSLNGLPGETLHSYIADTHPENNPWHGIDEWALKDEVNKLLNATLRERERDIIRLYYGLDNECLTWEEISKRIGLSRERVRQVGLVALEKLKHAARKRRLEAMLVKN